MLRIFNPGKNMQESCQADSLMQDPYQRLLGPLFAIARVMPSWKSGIRQNRFDQVFTPTKKD